MKTYIVTIIDRYGESFPAQGKAVGNTATEALKQWDEQHNEGWSEYFTDPDGLSGTLLVENDKIYYSGEEVDVIVKELE